ncbi:MAG: type II toxin-antitoxin system HicA family toxin [Candidatus Hydrogenedentes bacterium]|nr:type II toxin-antitoxin system HicA family toxin [Candidatus Hydrogenedentota bacterium]
MNAKQRNTLRKIFERPTRADIRWTDVMSLFRALGAEIDQGSGSRTGIALKGKRAVFHQPHPKPVAKKGLIDSVRAFLSSLEIKP